MLSKTKEYRAIYWKKYRSEKKPYVQIVCLKCGNKFIKISKGNPKTCNKCRLGECKKCLKKFVRRNLKQKFCSNKCLWESKKGFEPKQLIENRGVKPRTYHLHKRDKHGSAFDRDWRKKIFEEEVSKRAKEIKKEITNLADGI